MVHFLSTNPQESNVPFHTNKMLKIFEVSVVIRRPYVTSAERIQLRFIIFSLQCKEVELSKKKKKKGKNFD